MMQTMQTAADQRMLPPMAIRTGETDNAACSSALAQCASYSLFCPLHEAMTC